MNFFAVSPKILINKAKIKKRNPLDKNEDNIKINIFKFNPPDAIVINLQGIGEIPAMKTIKAPFSA